MVIQVFVLSALLLTLTVTKKEQATTFVAVLQPHAVYVCLFLSSALRKKTVILL